jgi:hypothetical protein
MIGIRRQASGVRCQVSGVRCQVSGVRRQATGDGCSGDKHKAADGNR